MKAWVFPLAVLLMAACKSDNEVSGVTTETETGELAGLLVFNGGAAAEGASVTLTRAGSSSVMQKPAASSALIAATDGQGRYSFKDLDSGTYNLSASIRQGQDTLVAYRFNIEFKRKLFLGTDTLVNPGRIEVKIVSGGKPVSQVSCYIPGTSYIAISDKDGICMISDIAPGAYDVAFLHPTFSAGDVKQVTVRPGGLVILDDVRAEIDPAKAPPTPENLSSEYDTATGLVSLHWGNVDVSDLDGYVLYRDTAGSVVASRLTTGFLIKDTVYQDPVYGNLQDTSTRNLQYKIQSQDKQGNVSLFGVFPPIRVERPNLPARPDPLNGATGVSVSPLLSWAPVSGANVAYTVYLGLDPVPENIAGSGLTADSIRVSGLKKSSRYYWRVAVENGGVKTAGPIWSFTTGSEDPPKTYDLVAYWDFNEGTGLILGDKSGHGHAGKIQGAEWTSGIEGKALSFDGVKDRVEVPFLSDLNASEFTLSAWIKTDEKGHSQSIIDRVTPDGAKWNYRMLIPNRNDSIEGHPVPRDVIESDTKDNFTSHWDYIAFGKTAVTDGTWHQVVATQKDRLFRIYVDGALDAEKTIAINAQTGTTQPLLLGDCAFSQLDFHFHGLMDEVRIYNRAQDSDEITAEWLRLKPIATPENKLISVPGGSFTDDSNHTATVSGFSLQETEVTLGQFRLFMPGRDNVEGANQDLDAVNSVTWVEAIQYANWLSKHEGLDTAYIQDTSKTVSDRNWGDKSYWTCDFTKNGYRLPTGDEWEYAAKAGTNRAHATDDGTTGTGKANLPNSSAGHVINVKSYPPNPWGLYDMTGNLWEWVWDGTQGVWGDPKPKPANRVDFHASPEDVNRNYNTKRGASYLGNSDPARTTEIVYSYDNGYFKKDHGFRLMRKK